LVPNSLKISPSELSLPPACINMCRMIQMTSQEILFGQQWVMWSLYKFVSGYSLEVGVGNILQWVIGFGRFSGNWTFDVMCNNNNVKHTFFFHFESRFPFKLLYKYVEELSLENHIKYQEKAPLTLSCFSSFFLWCCRWSLLKHEVESSFLMLAFVIQNPNLSLYFDLF
jgi:hypothetical protein